MHITNKSSKHVLSMHWSAHGTVCFETLLATIVLWIALFGLNECAMQYVDMQYHMWWYLFLFLLVIIFLTSTDTSFCSLL